MPKDPQRVQTQTNIKEFAVATQITQYKRRNSADKNLQASSPLIHQIEDNVTEIHASNQEKENQKILNKNKGDPGSVGSLAVQPTTKSVPTTHIELVDDTDMSAISESLEVLKNRMEATLSKTGKAQTNFGMRRTGQPGRWTSRRKTRAS